MSNDLMSDFLNLEPNIGKALAKLRQPFEANQIGKLPKPTKAQTDAVKADFKAGVRCEICHTWHHPKVVHLDYVGHAALTDRLLDVDPLWSWEPLAFDPAGLPLLDAFKGLWIKLTVCGVTRLGYGNAEGKTGGDAIKEIIGDALRNAAMRFGAALELWHKGELHLDTPDKPPTFDWTDEEVKEAAVMIGDAADRLMGWGLEEADIAKAIKAPKDKIGDSELSFEVWGNRLFSQVERWEKKYKKVTTDTLL